MPYLDIQNQITAPTHIEMEVAQHSVTEKVNCYHCGSLCEEKVILSGNNSFCCTGCKAVYEILNDNNLCEYYELDRTPGVSLLHVREESYAYLEEPQVAKKILAFSSDSFCRVQFSIPAIHCISCIW